jgi:hypothetical protein
MICLSIFVRSPTVRPGVRACVRACPCGACHVTRARAFLPQALSYTVFFPQKAIPPPLWLVAVELFITVTLVFEVFLRVLADGARAFCSRASNVADVLVAALCVAAFAMFCIAPAATDEIEEDVALLVRCIRDVVRLLRIILLCKNQRRAQEPPPQPPPQPHATPPQPAAGASGRSRCATASTGERAGAAAHQPPCAPGAGLG